MNIKLLQMDCSLKDVLTYKKAQDVFRTFLQGEFAEEALLFFNEVPRLLLRPLAAWLARTWPCASVPAQRARAAPQPVGGRAVGGRACFGRELCQRDHF